MKYIFFLIISINFTFAQTGINVNLLSNITPSQPSFSDIWGYVDSQGNEYALIAGYFGTYIYNVSNPVNPSLVEYIPGPGSTWRDIKTHSNYAYIITEGRGEGQGLQIVDLSNLPASAALVNTTDEYFTGAHNIFIDNGYAYVIGTEGGGGMHILDLTIPTNPVRKSYYTQSGYIHDVYVWNDTVVACAGNNQSYHLVDVTNKSVPFKISESQALPGIYAHAGWMTEDKRYFFGTEEFNRRDITVWDIQDRTSWDLINSSWQMPSGTTVHNLFIKDTIAHISYYGDGYVALNISNPANPKLIGQFDTFNGDGVFDGAWGVYPYLPSGNIIVSDIDKGLFVLRISDELVPVIVHSAKSELNYAEDFNIKTKIFHNVQLTDVILYYRVIKNNITGNWNSVNGVFTNVEDEFQFQIPVQEHQSTLEYYFAVKDQGNKVVTLPAGGNGINPPGINPPSSFFVSNVIIPGTPLLQNYVPQQDSILLNFDGTLNFSVTAIDTSNLNVTYFWWKNSQVTGFSNSYFYRSFPQMPYPRIDTIRVRVSNGYNNIEKIWLVHVDLVLNVDENNNSVNNYSITQNFPNPFNPSTLIKYSIPNEDFVTIEIFNMLGEKVHTLLNEIKSKGEHQIMFDASSFSSGIYFARIKSGSFIQNIKMVLMK